MSHFYNRYKDTEYTSSNATVANVILLDSNNNADVMACVDVRLFQLYWCCLACVYVYIAMTASSLLQRHGAAIA